MRPVPMVSARYAEPVLRTGWTAVVDALATTESTRRRHARRHDVAASLEHYRSAIAEWQRTGAWNALWVTFRTLIGVLVSVGASRRGCALRRRPIGPPGFPPFRSDAATLRDAKERMRSELGDAAFRQCADKGSSRGRTRWSASPSMRQSSGTAQQ
jgi:hypothetical protein